MLIKLSQNSPDVILLTGDYYVDHPSFGIAIIARLLESLSLSVWIVSQPDPESNFSELKNLPQPKLFFGITSGSLDSTLNLYTVNKVRRVNDVYSPGGKGKNRVKNAVITYANALRNFFPESVIIAGGVEATLRKFAHYDFFDKKIKPSILENCGINYIFYGMAEKSLSSFVLLLKKKKFEKIKKLPGICYRVENPSSENENYLFLPDFETLSNKQASLEKTSKLILSHTHFLEKKCLIQKQLKHTVISNPPSAPLNFEEIDRIYSLPFTYKPVPELPNSTL
ncbi:MAG: YgiQ family radical SAM protein, partial [Candidatus Muiribacteriota bacterium]